VQRVDQDTRRGAEARGGEQGDERGGGNEPGAVDAAGTAGQNGHEGRVCGPPRRRESGLTDTLRKNRATSTLTAMRCRRFLPALLLLGLVGGCTAPTLPSASDLLGAAESNFAGVRSAHFSVTVNGVLPGLPLSTAEGDATLDDGGRATGHAELAGPTSDRKFSFTVDGTHATTHDSTGASWSGRTTFTVASFLGPDGGLSGMLRSLAGPQTETQEPVHGVDMYRVGATLPANAATRLLPQIHSAVNVKVWITTAQPRRFARLWLQVPPPTDKDSPVMFEVELSHENQPVPAPRT
jgi:lipoprotein LprG